MEFQWRFSQTWVNVLNEIGQGKFHNLALSHRFLLDTYLTSVHRDQPNPPIVGESYKLRCHVRSQGNPIKWYGIEWSKDGKDLQNNERYDMEHYKLTIQVCESHLGKLFRCFIQATLSNIRTWAHAGNIKDTFLTDLWLSLNWSNMSWTEKHKTERLAGIVLSEHLRILSKTLLTLW